MKLHASRIPTIANEIVKTLLAAGDIEATSPKEVGLDIESVLRNFLQMEREVNDSAKELLQRTGRGLEDLNRVRESIAESKGMKLGDEAIIYVLEQLVEAFHDSPHVEEIYPDDVVLRRKMAAVIRKYAENDEALDKEVRGQIKNLAEGSRAWEVEYARVMGEVRRKRGLA